MDSGAQKKKKKKKKKKMGTAEVTVEPCVSVITVLHRYRYCHPTTRLSRADLENHHYSGVVTSNGNGHIPVDDYARRTIIFKRKS